MPSKHDFWKLDSMKSELSQMSEKGASLVDYVAGSAEVEDFEDKIWKRGKYNPEHQAEVRRAKARLVRAENALRKIQRKVANTRLQATVVNEGNAYWEALYKAKQEEEKEAIEELGAAQATLAELESQ